MRWSIVRLIWARELRDQLRDRRTVFMVVVLPLLLYPILGFGLLQFAQGLGRQQSVIGVVGVENLPPTDVPPRRPHRPRRLPGSLRHRCVPAAST